MKFKRILVTGANGFIGKNLIYKFNEYKEISVIRFLREDSIDSLSTKLKDVDLVIHLAGENRPINEEDYKKGNEDFTHILCTEMERTNKNIPIIMTSSTQAENQSAYGLSKYHAELCIKSYSENTGSSAVIYRLPGVFGKWCKPNYNSVVATFCHNIANNIPIEVHERAEPLTLIYIDDVVSSLMEIVTEKKDLEKEASYERVIPEYSITLDKIAQLIKSFRESRKNLISEEVGKDFTRALYSTYLSYLPKEEFKYELKSNIDTRGAFTEVLKTKDSGQFSYFTAHPGITRGGHYHHSKTEKFLVVKGKAEFRFINILTKEKFNLKTDEKKPTIVETIPGWAHDITNVGDSEMIVLLWANEIFDPENPDTIWYEI